MEYYHCESATTFPMLDYFYVANAGWFAIKISIMTLSSPLFNRGSFLGKRGLFTSQTTRLAVLRVVFQITCSAFIAGPKIKNMGFLSGGDDLKKINAMLRGKAERQALPCLHSPGGATNLRKLKN